MQIRLHVFDEIQADAFSQQVCFGICVVLKLSGSGFCLTREEKTR